MTLEDLGYPASYEKFRIDNKLDSFETGRIIAEHKERYTLYGTAGEFDAEVTGNMRFTARSREEFPAVGDWVAFSAFGDGFAIIHRIFPRLSILKRKAVGQTGEVQVIATNIDYGLLVQSVDRDFNLNRLERYLTICNDAGVAPIIVLSKIDLGEKQRLEEIIRSIEERIPGIPIFPISNETQEGYTALVNAIEAGKTYCMLGSSGVGKSSLLNMLSGRQQMKTGAISTSTSKGRHVTSHRELVVLENGGLLIDNPGMREVGIADADGGLETTFDSILRLAAGCRFKDCTHTSETGCAVLEAVENGDIDSDAYENYMKMEREKIHFESTVAERRKKEKAFGKILKDYHQLDLKQRKHPSDG